MKKIICLLLFFIGMKIHVTVSQNRYVDSLIQYTKISKNDTHKLSVLTNISLNSQKEVLDTTFIDWQGDLEQVDDVLIVGIRI